MIGYGGRWADVIGYGGRGDDVTGHALQTSDLKYRLIRRVCYRERS